MIFGNLPRIGDGGALAARMWAQAGRASLEASGQVTPDQVNLPPGMPALPIDLPPVSIDLGPVRLPGPGAPQEGISVIL